MEKDRMLMSQRQLEREFRRVKLLGEGTEGKVSLWRHKWKEEHIAVKQPARGTDFHRNMLKQELKNLKMVGTHPNVVSLLGWDDYYAPIPPGIFLDYCQLGDLLEYQNLLVDAGHYVPEESIWKFLVDMSRGLDYLHNHLAVPYIHGDLKPSNILVARPPGCRNDEVPLLPIFKLADISRLVPYIPGQGPNHMFFGTPEYGPPFSERRAVAPAVDIYAIGATVQHLALGCYPTQDRKAFIREVMLQGMDAPHEKDLNHIKWRNLIPVVYRPINAAAEEQRTKYKLQHPNPPYSDVLNDWYSMCLEHEKHRRISADILTDWFVPLAEGQIEVLAAKRERDRAADIARKLRETATRAKGGAEKSSMPQRSSGFFIDCGTVRPPARPPAPSYQDNRMNLSFDSGSDVPGENTRARDRQMKVQIRVRNRSESNEFQNLKDLEKQYLEGKVKGKQRRR